MDPNFNGMSLFILTKNEAPTFDKKEWCLGKSKLKQVLERKENSLWANPPVLLGDIAESKYQKRKLILK